MKTFKIMLVAIAIWIALPSIAQEIQPAEVKMHMKRVADWQIEHYGDTYSNKKVAHHPLIGPTEPYMWVW